MRQDEIECGMVVMAIREIYFLDLQINASRGNRLHVSIAQPINLILLLADNFWRD